MDLLSKVELLSHQKHMEFMDGVDDADSEQILLRWFNYHLQQAGHPRKVGNFSGDIKV